MRKKLLSFLLILALLLSPAVSVMAAAGEVGASPSVLIAYFSWAGHTKQLAEEIHTQIGGDLFEIRPETPYTSDIHVLSGIALQEQHDNARPALGTHVADMSQYDVVFIGYPCWWSNMPMPVFTFLEEYSFTGKTVVPFTSYGENVFGRSLDSIKELLPDATIAEGLAIQEHTMQEAPAKVTAWLQNLGFGNAGNTGNTGNAGHAGNTGNAGNMGNTGNAGNAGSEDTGNAGNTGNTGNEADTNSGSAQTAVDLSGAASVTLSQTSYVYNGKEKKPGVTVKAGSVKLTENVDYTVSYKDHTKIGTASVIVTGTGSYTGKITKTFSIVPKAASISGKISAASKGFTVKWKKQDQPTTGYQVQYATDKKFTQKTTSVKTVRDSSATKLTVSKLKAQKKYYVRIRNYETVNGKNYFSGWSAVKSVTTKR